MAGDDERARRLEKKATRIAVALVIAGPVLGIGVGALGAAEVYPYEYAMTAGLAAMLVPIGLALLIGAVGGLYLMGGRAFAPLGVVFVAGFAGLVYGLAVGSLGMRNLGVALLAVSGAVFYLAGVVSQRAPMAALLSWGTAASLVGGAAVAAVGYVLDQWAVLLFGAMAAACASGALIGRVIVRRRPAVAKGATEPET